MGKSKSIFEKTFGPVLAIFLILLSIYTVFVHQSVLKYLKENSYEVLKEQTINRREYVEGKLSGQWSSFSKSVEQITATVETIVDENGAALSQIHTDAALNQEILKNVTGEVIDILKNSGDTEIFLILDGASSLMNPSSHAGIYIRNSAPDIYNGSNSNLLFERGNPDISKEWQIPLDTYWKTAFYLDETDGFFYKPLQAARESSSTDVHNFGYWSFAYPVNEKDIGVLSYSVPLIGTDGTVYGVMGIGVDENYFRKFFQLQAGEKSQSRAYVLARTTDGINYEPIVVEGTDYTKEAILDQNITLSRKEYSSIYLWQNVSGEELCVNPQELKLYSANTPFEEETWAVLGMQEQSKLLKSYNRAGRLLAVFLATSALICISCIFWFSQFISEPIQNMVNELRKSNPNQPIRLTKTRVAEVDELADSVENLSVRVAEAYSNITKIIEMADAGIAVFEYKEQENLVFYSEGFYEMMGWGSREASKTYVDGSEFKKPVEEWIPNGAQQSERLLELPAKENVTRWVKLSCVREEGSVLGVATDVTADILEKQKIEYERDYDVLTELLNRRAFEEMMQKLFAEPGNLKSAAMLVWDMDNLKYVNDVYGHSVGDEYIAALADGLKQLEDPGLISARRSGDEFVTFIYGYENENEIQCLIDKIWEQIRKTEITLPDGRRYRIRVSMGKAWYPKDAEDFQTLFQYADFAMYMAKHRRKGTMADFEQELYQENRLLLHGQEAFNNLLEKHLVRYALQPIVRTKDGSTYGYEMLMRSTSEVFQSPLDILRMAHSQSRLYDVEVLTWFEAMKEFVSQIEKGNCDPKSRVFINSIANQIMNPDMLQLFEKAYREYLSRIVCEFTEEEQDNQQITRKKRELLRRWNGRIAIDDYGCGYNSETILLDTSPDIVKIDMSIVRGIHRDENRKRLVSNLVLYAKERGILVLGEGVETREEMETLILLGVDLLQGYYIAKPDYEAADCAPKVREEIQEFYKNR